MSAAKKSPVQTDVEILEKRRSGEHAISLDEVIRRQFERAFETDLQTTSRLSRFDLEEMLDAPEVRPTDPPAPESVRENEVMGEVLDAIVNARPSTAAEAIVRAKFDLEVETRGADENAAAVDVGSLPPPAIEIDRAS